MARRAVIYIRTSSKMQAEKSSPVEQEASRGMRELPRGIEHHQADD